MSNANEGMQEESWEGSAFSAEFTKYSSSRIPLLIPSGGSQEEIMFTSYIDIQSIDTSNMTLLDVCNYIPDDQVDGSGHCVWMGALFFLHAIGISAILSKPNPFGLLHGQTVMELGCGTGTAGIGLFRLLQQRRKELEKIVFVDNDPQVLELCRQNCYSNNIPESSFQIFRQGSWIDTAIGKKDAEDMPQSVDTIIATDVLYDLKIIQPFFKTASLLLELLSPSSVGPKKKSAKHLIVSHVPRWFLPREEKRNTESTKSNPSQELEQHIIQQANAFSFILIQTIRPQSLLQSIEASSDNMKLLPNELEILCKDLRGMDEAAGVLWIFQMDRNDTD